MTTRSMERSAVPVTVHKFGGAALADAEAILHAARIIAARQAGAVVVASAMRGVTDALLHMSVLASRDESQAVAKVFDDLRRRHRLAATALKTDDGDDSMVASIDREFDHLSELVTRMIAGSPPGAAITDAIAAHGERMSASMFAAGLSRLGVSAKVVDAMQVVHADALHGNATPDFERTVAAVNKHLLPLIREQIVPVVAGFIGSAPNGALVTLGRGGSDLTATLLARALNAESVTLWKDVPGVLTADPQVVPDARLVPRLHVREAAELAYYGAKVLHPRALIGLRDETRLFIRPLANPKSPGTQVTTRRDSTLEKRYPVRAITAIGAQAIINISGDGMVGVPGIAARAFGALERAGVSVALISQASSEHSICLVVPAAVAGVARESLQTAFTKQLEKQEVEGIDLLTDVAIVAVVGLGMSGTRGVAAKVFAAIADAEVNVIAIAQGASELNISVVVEEASVAAVQRAVHSAFRLDKIGGGAAATSAHADVVILGYGRIGREVATQLGVVARSRALRVVAVIDSSGYVFEPRGLSKRRLAALAAAKGSGTALADMPRGKRASAESALAHVRRHALSRPILVDVTAGDTSAVLEAALAGGMDIVLANKRPLAARRGTRSGLTRSATSRGRRVLHEATVGAGLPIIDTISKLKESGDEVLSIEGCPSGTLGYLFGELGRGTAFSTALRAAMALGYTEPDPREDLSGMDVARKALILGHLLGFKGKLESVIVESLVPEEYRDLATSEFISRLEELDPVWRERVDDARSRDSVLRYRATAGRGGVRVGLVAVNAASSLGALMGTDNQFSITTSRYRDNAIVITGPGAGVAVTAAGVLNDVLKLAGSR
jgi:bifunctional aspartokinase / homoserine dehydrogenase 1